MSLLREVSMTIINGVAVTQQNIQVQSSTAPVASTSFMLSNSKNPPMVGTKIPGGGVLFVENGELKYQGSCGTISTLAIA